MFSSIMSQHHNVRDMVWEIKVLNNFINDISKSRNWHFCSRKSWEMEETWCFLRRGNLWWWWWGERMGEIFKGRLRDWQVDTMENITQHYSTFSSETFIFMPPANIYLFKVNTIKRSKICSKLTIEISKWCHWHRSGVFLFPELWYSLLCSFC